MKLTTKLLLSVGLAFVLGTPAFADSPIAPPTGNPAKETKVTIINKDCPPDFMIYENMNRQSNQPIHVERGIPKPIYILTDDLFFGSPYGDFRVASTNWPLETIVFRRLLGPGKSYTITMQMKNYFFGKVCSYK